MISEFVREQKRYTQKDLSKIMHCTEESIVPIIRKLKEFGVLKTVKASDAQKDMSDLIDSDIEVADVVADDNSHLYVFTFVGVIVVLGRVLKCYPKYLQYKSAPTAEMKQVLKVLEKYNTKEQIIRMFNDGNEDSSFNLLAVLLFLLYDYYENGVYSNAEDIIEVNGPGEILWNETVNDTFALISGNRPYYVELQTKKRVNSEYDYFRRLHKCVLTKASKELGEAGLLDLFEITGVDLTDEVLDDFGEDDYILYRLEQELDIQFSTRKQMLLKTIYTYIAKGGSLYDIDCLSLFGTNSFNLVWEKICADIMDNKLDTPLGSIKLPIPLKSAYDSKKKLKEFIEKPLWGATEKTATKTLIPDLITISKVEDRWHFIIFDAKYYVPKLKKGIVPSGQPGIESVTKQYLYQLAYKSFINDHEFSSVKNCFLMPTEKDIIEERGEVSMEMLSSMGLENIKVRFIPAKMAYDHYLGESKINIETLNL